MMRSSNHSPISNPVKKTIRNKLVSGRHQINELVIVAGPSGAGKSTFLRQLATATLPPSIGAALPQGSDKWPQYKVAKGCLGGLNKELETKPLNGAVLHYDLTTKLDSNGKFHIRRKVKDIITLSKSLTVVNLTTPRTHLFAQLAASKIGVQNTGNIRWTLWIWRIIRLIRLVVGNVLRLLPNNFTESLSRLRPDSPLWTSSNKNLAKQLDKCSLYVKTGRIESLFEEWQKSLRSLGKPGFKIIHLFVVPDFGSQDARIPKWRLVGSNFEV